MHFILKGALQVLECTYCGARKLDNQKKRLCGCNCVRSVDPLIKTVLVLFVARLATIGDPDVISAQTPFSLSHPKDKWLRRSRESLRIFSPPSRFPPSRCPSELKTYTGHRPGPSSSSPACPCCSPCRYLIRLHQAPALLDHAAGGVVSTGGGPIRNSLPSLVPSLLTWRAPLSIVAVQKREPGTLCTRMREFNN